MSNKWRKEKRVRAYEILGNLWKKSLDNIQNDKLELPFTDAVEYYSRSLTEITPVVTALMMLKENLHVTTSKKDTYKVIPTPKGIEAYLSGYYLVENRKDRLESYEYITKWIIPVISIILSIAAFAISIIVLVHTWYKK